MKSLYDPKLREAAEDFRALCKKYDCMGTVCFVSKTHAEFATEISPSWSVMHFEEMGVRFKSKRADFPSKEVQHEVTEATVHGITSFLNWNSKQVRLWNNILGQLREHMKILYTVWNDPDSVPGDDQ